MSLAEHDSDTIGLLRTKARGLEAARRKIARHETLCTERAVAAIDECVAILHDAAQNCADQPNLVSIREAAL